MTGGTDADRRSMKTRASEPTDGTAVRVGIVGVGSQIMGDDGLGKHVVDELAAGPVGTRADVSLTHAGTMAFFALEAMSGCELGIVVDAIETGAPAGTVHRYRYVDGSFDGPVPDITLHDFSFADALQAGTEAYELPPELLVYGVEPASIEPSLELSDPVERAVPTLVEAIMEQLPAEPGERAAMPGEMHGRQS